MHVEGVAERFGVDEDFVRDMREMDMGWGNIHHALRLAELAAAEGITVSATISDIVALKQSGEGWGEIAKQFGFHPGLGGDNLGAVMSGRWVSETVRSTPVVPMAGSNYRAPMGSEEDVMPAKKRPSGRRSDDSMGAMAGSGNSNPGKAGGGGRRR
jgi:hypothetical protein